MQYLLTEKEYLDLTEKRPESHKKTLQQLCTMVADYMPVNAGWRPVEPSPWGCILSQKGEWYCDACPVQKLCPQPSKSWSK